LVVNQVNAFYKQKDKSEAEKAVNYLKQQIKMTSLAEVKESIAELLKEETQKLALIEAKQLYVFEYIDPPAVMEQKSEPGRALICILSALLGGMLSIFLVLIKHYSLRKKVS
jgi:LPS O-antigen subunit length determinant protein (WzzB/FepE family)